VSKQNTLPTEMQQYYATLLDADHQASISFDKAIMTLSGGALGISITFLHDVVPNPLPETKIFLAASWIVFIASLTTILVSYLTSMASLRKTMEQVFNGTIHKEKPGGYLTTVTVFLRNTSVVCFVLGVISFLFFAFKNF